MSRISPASQTVPPCGASASPQTVTISDRARGGSALSVRCIQRATVASALVRVPGRCVAECDTESS